MFVKRDCAVSIASALITWERIFIGRVPFCSFGYILGPICCLSGSVNMRIVLVCIGSGEGYIDG